MTLPPRAMTPRILVVDDDPHILRFFQVNLERCGFVVEMAGSGAQALARLRVHRPALLIVDLIMPGMDV